MWRNVILERVGEGFFDKEIFQLRFDLSEFGGQYFSRGDSKYKGFKIISVCG